MQGIRFKVVRGLSVLFAIICTSAFVLDPPVPMRPEWRMCESVALAPSVKIIGEGGTGTVRATRALVPRQLLLSAFPTLTEGTTAGTTPEVEMDVAVKDGKLGSNEKLENECQVSRLLADQAGVEKCLAMCKSPSGDTTSLVLAPLLPASSPSTISSLTVPLQPLAASQLLSILVGVLSHRISVSDVQFLFDSRTGSPLLIDLTEATKFSLPPSPSSNKNLDIALAQNFVSEVLSQIPSTFDFHSAIEIALQESQADPPQWVRDLLMNLDDK